MTDYVSPAEQATNLIRHILGPVIALPFYFAYRNLKAGEIRE